MAENSGSNGNEGEIEYESDPEESKLSLTARRREASDDEDGDEEQQHRSEDEMRTNQRVARRIGASEGESEGAVAEYDDASVEDVDHVEEGELEEEEYGGEGEYGEEYFEEGGGDRGDDVAGDDGRNKAVTEGEDGNLHGGRGGGEERKEAAVEPYAVPTAGAFYMHDDRFGDNAGGGKNRRTSGGRRLWESRDNRKWGHDKFEELTAHERHHERRTASRGHYRGRGRMRSGAERREFTNNIDQNNKKQSDRGRGPRRYQPSNKHKDEALVTSNRESGEFVDKLSRASSVSGSGKPVSNAAAHSGPPRKQVASNLNVASPPFYPTGSSSSSIKDNSCVEQRDAKVDAANQNGKQIGYSVGMEKLSINESTSAMSGKPQLRGQGRGVASNNFANKVTTANQLQNFQTNPYQNHNQSSVHGSQTPQPKVSAGAASPVEPGAESPSASGDFKASLAAKGSGKGSFLYGAPQVIGGPGNVTAGGRGDPNFPAFLPIMQFGGQHPGGIGVPAVGMAFPGYVGQPQHGRANSEMTWLPVLAGAAGSLGASYCPPYITVDGSYNIPPPGQTSSAATSISSNENDAAKVGGELMPARRPDIGTENMGPARQKNSRRYTEMKFSQ